MSEEQSSYRQIMKATSVFGGVQVFNILVQLIRSKVVAVLLGPSGIGIMGLLQTTVLLVASATNFGLGTSAVRDISEASREDDENKILQTVAVFRKLVWLTGLLGMAVTVALSPLLSKLTFGTYDYTLAFVALAVTLLINQLAAGQVVLLQGLRKINWLAKAIVYASVLGLLASLPLYYFFGNAGIVPAMVLTALALLAVQYRFANKMKIKTVALTFREAVHRGKPMLKLGFMLSLSSLITVAASYIIRIFISNTGGVADVGLYNAGFAIIGTYVGIVFTAMSTDYYPRLAAVAHSNAESRTVINQQAEVALLILAPIIMIFLVFINWVIILLYSTQFIEVNDMILYAALGMFFKTASWAIGFLFLAKGNSRLFFWNELLTNTYTLALNILGYHYWGLTGLGVSFLASYFLHLIQVFLVAKTRYGFSFSSDFIKIFVLQLLLALVCLLVVKLAGVKEAYIFGSAIVLVSGWHAYRELDKRLDLKAILASIKNKLR
ncbi:O-antigen translocase [Chryseobacterium sp.]|uniref:O-antigen translocase n=1 Tax=Chryseobacterium sp. TaxID=1871047 RepID=UPI0011CA56D4|nr:O-antigen translocase [Chryseobacterium sp.]TXF77555.1 O-antigen translocase [Chryseobacterium sp.]